MERNLFSFKLLSMSPDNLKQLKSFVVSSMESNLQPIQEKLTKIFPKLTDSKKTIEIISDFYSQKQQQVDNLANFIRNLSFKQVQFLSSLEDVFDQLDFKEKKINGLKKTLIEQADFIIMLQDDIQEYKDKLINAQDYIHWMEEEMQYFDLLCLPNHKPEKQNTLSKCRSQRTFNSSQFFISNENNQRRKKIDYQRLKFYIETLKQQKNHLIREYNNLVDEHQRKLNECEKHSILLDELFEKYKHDSNLSQISQISPVPLQKQKNPQNIDSLIRKYASQKNLTIPSDNDTSISIQAIFHEKSAHSCYHTDEKSQIKPQIEAIRHRLRQDYDESFTQGNSIFHSFISDAYHKRNLKMDTGVNTKKVYYVSTFCQTLSTQNQVNKSQNSLTSKLKLSQRPTLDDSYSQNQDIQCEISINLKNVPNKDIKSIDFSRLLNKQLFVQSKNSKGYSICHRQKLKNSNHLCQHMYCFLTNKVVTERIKKYKYIKK